MSYKYEHTLDYITREEVLAYEHYRGYNVLMDIKKFYQQHKGIILGLLYLVSPFDVLPEAFLGPVGLVDDAFVVFILIAVFGFRFVQKRLSKKADKPNSEE